jgi:hypothetical protein
MVTVTVVPIKGGILNNYDERLVKAEIHSLGGNVTHNTPEKLVYETKKVTEPQWTYLSGLGMATSE